MQRLLEVPITRTDGSKIVSGHENAFAHMEYLHGCQVSQPSQRQTMIPQMFELELCCALKSAYKTELFQKTLPPLFV